MFVVIAWLVILVLKSLDQSLLAAAIGASACQNRWWVLLSVHAISIRPEVGAGIVSSMHMARSDSQSPVWYVRTFAWYSVAQGCAMLSHVLMSAVCMQLLHVQHMHSLRLTPPIISCIHLVVWLNVTVKPSNCSSVVLPVPITSAIIPYLHKQPCYTC